MIKAPPAPPERLQVRKTFTSESIRNTIPKPAAPTKPLAIIQTGALGDIINVLPVARAIYGQSKAKPPLLVAERYSYVFDRVSYVSPVVWRGNDSDAKGATAFLGDKYKSVACMLWLSGFSPRMTNNFLKEHWHMLGWEKHWGKLPVVFDRRNSQEEQKVLDCFSEQIQGPFILMAIGGNTSPAPDKDWVKRAVTRAANGMPVIDITDFRCKNPLDLVALMEQATLFISSDSGPAHINRATKTPMILLGRPLDNRWFLSEFIENVKAVFTYDTLKVKEYDFCSSIDRLIGGEFPSCSVVTGSNESYLKLGSACFTSLDRAAPVAVRKKFEAFDETDRHPSWSKIGAVLRQLSVSTPGAWVIWVDADCVVNHWPPVEEFLSKTNADIVFSKDWNGICMGFWAAKNCQWSIAFLNALLLCGDVSDHTESRFSPDGPKWEQNAVKALLKDFPALGQHSAFFPEEWITAQPEQDRQRRFHIHHFGGGSAEERFGRMKTISPVDCSTVSPLVKREFKQTTPVEPVTSHVQPQRYSTNRANYRGPVHYQEDLKVFSGRDGLNADDPARFDFFCLAVDLLVRDGVKGDFVELGVYKGQTAAVLGRFAERLGRTIYLLDTFKGWDARDLVGKDAMTPNVFDDSSVAIVAKKLEDAGVGNAAVIIQGSFPETATHIPETARFAFVHLDCDLGVPMSVALRFFYPRVSTGGFIVIHDYLSNYFPALQDAVDAFSETIPEKLVPVPDASGTVVIRKASLASNASLA